MASQIPSWDRPVVSPSDIQGIEEMSQHPRKDSSVKPGQVSQSSSTAPIANPAVNNPAKSTLEYDSPINYSKVHTNNPPISNPNYISEPTPYTYLSMADRTGWVRGFCFSCDRQITGDGPYCSDACRLSDMQEVYYERYHTRAVDGEDESLDPSRTITRGFSVRFAANDSESKDHVLPRGSSDTSDPSIYSHHWSPKDQSQPQNSNMSDHSSYPSFFPSPSQESLVYPQPREGDYTNGYMSADGSKMAAKYARISEHHFGQPPPRPMEQAGNPLFANSPQHHGPHGPPALKLPLPKLTAHTFGLLNAFKLNEKPAISSPQGSSQPKQSFQSTPNQQQQQQQPPPRPIEQTSNTPFTNSPQYYGPHGPPASKLPPPKLTAHTLGLLNAFKLNEKPAISSPQGSSQPKQSFQSTPNLQQQQLDEQQLYEQQPHSQKLPLSYMESQQPSFELVTGHTQPRTPTVDISELAERPNRLIKRKNTINPYRCTNCVRRKISCNERRPTCTHCAEAGLMCEYKRPRKKPIDSVVDFVKRTGSASDSAPLYDDSSSQGLLQTSTRQDEERPPVPMYDAYILEQKDHGPPSYPSNYSHYLPPSGYTLPKYTQAEIDAYDKQYGCYPPQPYEVIPDYQSEQLPPRSMVVVPALGPVEHCKDPQDRESGIFEPDHSHTTLHGGDLDSHLAQSQVETNLDRTYKSRFEEDSDSDGTASVVSSYAASVLSIQSLASSATDLSKNSNYSVYQIATATKELITIFQEDEILVPLYRIAIEDPSIGGQRLQRNLRRLFKQYAESLKGEAKDQLEYLAARLVSFKARFLAQSIVERLEGCHVGKEISEAKAHGEKENSSDDEEEGQTVDDRAFDDLVIFREFLLSSDAFQALRAHIRSFVLPKGPHIIPEKEVEEKVQVDESTVQMIQSNWSTSTCRGWIDKMARAWNRLLVTTGQVEPLHSPGKTRLRWQCVSVSMPSYGSENMT
jgi:hypothetical protein